MQCKSLNVWSVYFFFNTLSGQNYFTRGYGVVQNSSGNSRGVGGYFSGQKLEIPGRRGAYMKFPPWWGYGYFLELHIFQVYLVTRIDSMVFLISFNNDR